MKRPRSPLADPRPPLLRDPRFWAGPTAALGAGLAWYAADSLRHRREGAFGYELVEGVDAYSPDFMRAAEALTGHPVNEGCEVELLINGDRIFPAMLETIESAKDTLCLETYVYWSGEIATEIAAAVCERAAAGVECRVLVDAVGAAKITDGLIDDMQEAGVQVCRFRPPKPYALPQPHQPHPSPAGDRRRPGWDDRRGGDRRRVAGRRARARQNGAIRTCGSSARSCAACRALSPSTGSRRPERCSAASAFLPELEPRPGGHTVQLIRSSAGCGRH